jgi:serine/threonine-protein kinase RsbW
MTLPAAQPLSAPGNDGLRLEAPAAPAAIGQLRRRVVDYATQMGASEAVGEAIRLAVSEALTNVVIHAYDGGAPGAMTLEARREESEQLTIVVLDEGHGFTADPVNPGLGLGLTLMAKMADSVVISSREGTPGTAVSMHFGLAQTGSRHIRHSGGPSLA